VPRFRVALFTTMWGCRRDFFLSDRDILHSRSARFLRARTTHVARSCPSWRNYAHATSNARTSSNVRASSL
jgi:hypothetical protein